MQYQLISVATVLRDYTEVEYKNDNHKMFVDIADCMLNAGVPVEQMLPEAQEAYRTQDTSFWQMVKDDYNALDSQVNRNNVDDLILDYQDMLA